MRYFIDPVLQAPTIGCMLMCFASALVGVLVFLRKRSLLGEALSHAAYPGVVLSVWIASAFFVTSSDWIPATILVGASIAALIGLWVIERLEHRFRVKNDAALCLVLSVFFGVGVLMASHLQVAHALSYKMIQIFLYGQAATLMNVHVMIYAILVVVTLITLTVFYRPIAVLLFDRAYAKSMGMTLSLLDGCVFALLVWAIVIGMRSVGVVLMAGMLIAPAVAARQWTNRLSLLFVLAGTFGAISGFMGNYLSVEIPLWGVARGWDWRFALPTGPMILLSASTIAIISLLLAPSRGVLSRCWRIFAFRQRCRQENVLKYLWKQEGRGVRFAELKQRQGLSWIWTMWVMHRLHQQGWIEGNETCSFRLTVDGCLKGSRLVRLHRLWEVYLVSLGHGLEKVHCSAEEMEHIITPAIERELIELLNNPHHDPHHQPIPPSQEPL